MEGASACIFCMQALYLHSISTIERTPVGQDLVRVLEMLAELDESDSIGFGGVVRRALGLVAGAAGLLTTWLWTFLGMVGKVGWMDEVGWDVGGMNEA